MSSKSLNRCRPKPLAVVTGCNRGLGLEVARRLVHDEGFRVAAVCRRMQDAERTVQDVLGGAKSGCVPIELDLSQGSRSLALSRAAGQIAQWAGASKLSLLVNNAAVVAGGWEFEGPQDEEAWSLSKTVNFEGPVALTKALLPALAPKASVVMVGSCVGDLAWLTPRWHRSLTRASSIAELQKVAHRSMTVARLVSDPCGVSGPYSLSKALLHRATEIFACDPCFEERGIRVKAVCPGWVSTDMGGDQAPIPLDAGADHLLETALPKTKTKTGRDYSATKGALTCHCHKNYDEEHTRVWEEKQRRHSSTGLRTGDVDVGSQLSAPDDENEDQNNGREQETKAIIKSAKIKRAQKRKRNSSTEERHGGTVLLLKGCWTFRKKRGKSLPETHETSKRRRQGNDATAFRAMMSTWVAASSEVSW